MPSHKYVINSVLRAAQVLDSFSFDKPTYTHSELANKLRLNKSTVTRLLYSLQEAGFLEKNIKTGEFRLTHRLFRIGSVYINQVDLHREAMPLLSDLASVCRETVHLAILDEFEVFYLDKVESSQSIAMISRVGNRNPAYCTGVGKVMLAHADDEDLESFLRSVQLRRYTANTITDAAELMAHLRRIAEQGYAIDDCEHEAEVKCVAAPVYDRSGKAIAAISISGPVFRMTRERIQNELISAIKETAAMISKRLGYLG